MVRTLCTFDLSLLEAAYARQNCLSPAGRHTHSSEIILLSHMNSRVTAFAKPCVCSCESCLGTCGTATCPNANLVRADNVHLGGTHSFTVSCRSPRPGYTHNWREAMAPYGLVVACRVSAVPNSPPGTKTELPCCHNRQNFSSNSSPQGVQLVPAFSGRRD